MEICQDYLGQTVFLDHLRDSPLLFLSIYAHIVPNNTLLVGQRVQAGDIIETLADTTERKNRMPAHLHLSIMEVDKGVAATQFTRDLICSSRRGSLIDPLQIIEAGMIEICFRNHKKERAENQR